MIIDIAAPGDKAIHGRERKEGGEYQDLPRGGFRMWRRTQRKVGGVGGDALGATERQDMQMGHLGITMRWEERRKAALLGAARKQRGGSLTFV